MSQDHYLVVFHDPHWDVSHRGNLEGPFRSREDAVQWAISAAAEDGSDAEVRVEENQEREFRTAWKAGQDPVPAAAKAGQQNQGGL